MVAPLRAGENSVWIYGGRKGRRGRGGLPRRHAGSNLPGSPVPPSRGAMAMRARSRFFRTLRASPGLAVSVVLAWAAGFGLGSAVLARIGGADDWSHPV